MTKWPTCVGRKNIARSGELEPRAPRLFPFPFIARRRKTMKLLVSTLAGLTLLSTGMVVYGQAPLAPIQEVSDVRPLAVAFEKSGRDRPLVLRSKKEVSEVPVVTLL